MATHSSVLAWRIPGTGEPGGLPSMGSHRVRHDWSDLAAAAAAWDWRIHEVHGKSFQDPGGPYCASCLHFSESVFLFLGQIIILALSISFWRRKGTGRADSILKKKETPSCTVSELWTMCLLAMGITYLRPNWPLGLINTRFHTIFPITKKNAITPYVVNHLWNLYGTHWCRLQCITSWPFWLWIMAVTWVYLPLTLSRLGLRNLGMWAWAVRLRYIRFSQKSVGVLG